jgi:hypothetical protein
MSAVINVQLNYPKLLFSRRIVIMRSDIKIKKNTGKDLTLMPVSNYFILSYIFLPVLITFTPLNKVVAHPCDTALT